MSKRIDVGRIEQKAYLTFYQDGLTELLIGVIIATFGLFSLLRTFLVVLISPLALILYVAGKRKITYPRTGYVEFSLHPRTAVKLALAVTGFFFWSLDLVLIIWNVYPANVPASWLNILDDYFIMVDGVGFAAFFVLLAFTIGVRRVYGYALLVLILFAILGLPQVIPSLDILERFSIIHTALGLTISVCGVFLLASFVQRYPVRSGGDVGAGSKGR
jgi:hypothetical protein